MLSPDVTNFIEEQEHDEILELIKEETNRIPAPSSIKPSLNQTEGSSS